MGRAGVRASEITDEDWDYVFLEGPEPRSASGAKAGLLKRMRAEFLYWYPFDLRVRFRPRSKSLLCIPGLCPGSLCLCIPCLCPSGPCLCISRSLS